MAKTLCFSLPDKTYKALEDLGRPDDKTVYTVIRDAIRFYLETLERDTYE